MSARAVLTWAIVAVFSLLAAGAAWYANHRDVRPSGAGALLLPGFADKVNQAARMTLSQGDRTMVVEKTPDGWRIKASGYPADEAKIKAVLVELVRMRKREPKTRLSAKYAKLDVDDPSPKGKGRRLTVVDESGRILADVVLGRRAFGRIGGGRAGEYVRLAGKAQSWLVEGWIEAGAAVSDWADDRIVDFADEKIIRLSVVHADGGKVEITSAGVDDNGRPKLNLTDLPQGAKVKNPYLLRRTLSDVASARFDDVAATTAAAATIGKELSRLEVLTGSGLKIIYQLYADKAAADAGWVAVEVAAPGKKPDIAKSIAVRVKGWRYKVVGDKRKVFLVRLDDLIENSKPADATK